MDMGDAQNTVKYLRIAAAQNHPEAQYLLGTFTLSTEEEDEQDEAEKKAKQALLLADDNAEKRRQRVNNEDDARDIKAIRKRARRAYKIYVTKLRAAKAQANPEKKDTSNASVMINRAKKEDLDRAFGKTLMDLLNPSFKVPSLKPEAGTSEVLDDTQAVEWIRRAAENDHLDAKVKLGNLCLQQETPLAKAAMEWYSDAALRKPPHPDALFNLGLLLFEGVPDADPPVEPNPKGAIPFFMKAAEVGDPSAQFFMGHLLRTGNPELGIEAQTLSSLIMLENAAKNGHSGAMFYLAQLYRSGSKENQIEVDLQKFDAYLKQAVQHEDPDALFCLADIYYNGSDGYKKNVDLAKSYYIASAFAGNANAYCCLGSMFYHGIGVEQNYEKAFFYYQEAADRHSLEAWKNLAEMYFLGKGVPKSPATADSIMKMLEKEAKDTIR
jgi:TPR repeat protein